MEKLNMGVGFMEELRTGFFSKLSNAQVLAIADVDSDRATKCQKVNTQ